MIRVRVQCILLDQNMKILLVKHRKSGKEYWVLPGGGVEYRETLVSALTRELKEELNIKLTSAKLLDIREFIPQEESKHNIDIYFFATGDISKMYLAENNGILADFGFFNAKEIDNITVYPSKKFIKHLIKKSIGVNLEKLH